MLTGQSFRHRALLEGAQLRSGTEGGNSSHRVKAQNSVAAEEVVTGDLAWKAQHDVAAEDG